MFNKVSMLPLTLLSSEVIILIVLLFNALKNQYSINFHITKWTSVFYLSFTAYLVVYSLVFNISAAS